MEKHFFLGVFETLMFMNGFIKKPLIGFGHETREMFRN